jgi:multiple sugar transport system ATP-binding protein
VREAAQILDLEPYLDRKPAKLSGGQRQRVAMGRAIVRQPQVFLMDEPLSNLDAKLRVQTRTQIAALQRRLGVTTVYVTHDQVEAMTMGDRVAVLDRGVLQQCASPRELFMAPVNLFVAGFIGSPSMNLLPAKVGDDGATHGTLTVPLTPDQRAALTSDDVTIGVRPEGWMPGTEGGLDVVVVVVEELGSESFLYCTDPAADDAVSAQVVARAEGLSSNEPGDRLSLVPRPDRLLLFDSATGARLPSA